MWEEEGGEEMQAAAVHGAIEPNASSMGWEEEMELALYQDFFPLPLRILFRFIYLFCVSRLRFFSYFSLDITYKRAFGWLHS